MLTILMIEKLDVSQSPWDLIFFLTMLGPFLKLPLVSLEYQGIMNKDMVMLLNSPPMT